VARILIDTRCGFARFARHCCLVCQLLL
jgi:hypothetical protein